MIDYAPRSRATLLLALCLTVGVGCGEGARLSPADAAMDQSFQPGKGSPVHPPRGERKVVRSRGAQSVQSDPLECNGAGEQTLANTELRVTGSTGAFVRGGCRLRLVNVELVANDGVVLEGGALTMVGGSITARGVAIRASGQASVELTNVEVKGTTGVQASEQARVTATEGRIEGSGVALALRDQASVVLDKTELDGPVAKDEGVKLTKIEPGAAVEAGEGQP